MATKAKPRASKKSTISVDFSDTETQAIIDEADYRLTVDEVEEKTSDNSGGQYLAITFKVDQDDSPFNGKKLYHNCSLQPQALFNLRGLLEALGFEVPQGVMELDPADMIGESCGASVAHEVYQGKTKARPVEFFPEEDLEGRAEPEAKPTKAAATKVVKKAKDEPAPEPEKPVTKKKKTAAAPALGVGDAVSFTDEEGDEISGIIKSIEDDAYTVTVGVGKKAEDWELELSDLTPA